MDSYTKTFLGSYPTNFYAQTTPAKFASLEDMNAEAHQVLNQKKMELEQYQKVVQDAEQILIRLNNEIEQKTNELSVLNNQTFSHEDRLEEQRIQMELETLQHQHNEEITRLRVAHEEEMEALKNDFQQTLSEAQNWAQRHSQIALQEKMDELESLRREAEETKRQLDEITYVQFKAPVVHETDQEQKKNQQEIAMLENQISELTSITREELRNSRAKIEETLAAIELRRKAHSDELARLDNEIAQRTETYEQHLQAIREQYDNERQTVEQSIQAANSKAESTERIIAQLEKHHETQLNQVLGDIETVRKSTINQATSRPRENVEELKSLIRESQKLQEECRSLDEEIKMVDHEIFSLEEENRELKLELVRYNNALNKVKS